MALTVEGIMQNMLIISQVDATKAHPHSYETPNMQAINYFRQRKNTARTQEKHDLIFGLGTSSR